MAQSSRPSQGLNANPSERSWAVASAMIPTVDDVNNYIYGGNADPDANDTPFTPEDEQCGIWHEAPNAKCHASFGDQGTTASVGAFGQLLQFSDFLGHGTTGMFCVDHDGTRPPYYVPRRLKGLDRLAREPFQFSPHGACYGLKFPDLSLKSDVQPKLKWVNWRWPRYEFEGAFNDSYDFDKGAFRYSEDLKLTTQWMVHNKVVLQRCLLENNGSKDMSIDLAVFKHLRIRDLDHLYDPLYHDHVHGENRYDAASGPKGYSWMCVRRFYYPPPAATQATDGAAASRGQERERPTGGFGPQSKAEREGQSDSTSPGSLGRENRQGRPYEVAVIMSVTIDGVMKAFDDNRDSLKWTECIKSQKSLKITTAYRMVVIQSSQSDWKSLVITAAEMRLDTFLRNEAPGRFLPLSTTVANDESKEESERRENKADIPLPLITFPQGLPTTTPTEHIEFVLLRNLEHILSVCAVPFTVATNESRLPQELRDDIQPVAMTCGDMAGHRICTSASYFSFEFLLNCASRLDRLPDRVSGHEYVKSLKDRIEKTCQGHMKWLALLEKNSERCFGANYWVNGNIMIKPSSSGSWIPKDGFVDTAFQLLKVASFTREYQQKYGACIKRLAKDWAYAWLVWLEQSDQRTKYVWPHAVEDDVNIFRLDDHVWIWRALKSLEHDMKIWKPVQKDAPEFSQGSKNTEAPVTAPSEKEITRLSKKYESSIVQREVLRRFTTENDARKRMLAVTRSPRETRFLFHARDTALFYGIDSGFSLQETSIREPWVNTIESQPYYDENREIMWESALRYALSIVVGSRRYRINNRSPDELVRKSTKSLFRIASPNGFFPGKLDVATQGPLEGVIDAENERDFYYHANFEIQYVLLTHAEAINRVFDKDPKSESGRPSPGSSSSQSKAPQGTREWIESELVIILPLLSDLLSRQATGKYPGLSPQVPANTWRGPDEQRLAMKKVIPFTRYIDSSNIVLLEDEWMFNYPIFFTNEPKINIDTDFAQAVLQQFDPSLVKGLDAKKLAMKYSARDSPGGAQPQPGTDSISTSRPSLSSSSSDVNLIIIDVPRRKRLDGKREDILTDISTPDKQGLWKALSGQRTAQLAKKRLVGIYNADPETAFLCAAASRGYEQAMMTGFFERHSRYETYLFDNCDMVKNRWETEVHMSYHELRNYKPRRQGINLLAPWKVGPFPGQQGKGIARIAFSFRIAGDFFDRYWTCHLLQYHTPSDVHKSIRGQLGETQRRALEIRLFTVALRSSTEHTSGILNEIKFELGVDMGSSSYSVPSRDAYWSWSTTWQNFDRLLQALEEDLSRTLDLVKLWDSREEARGKAKPRWTHNDEERYRAIINRSLFKLKRQTNELRRLYDDIKSLREWYANWLKDTREELGFRSNQNITSFTYVTVVFLPLGFAASVFSMSGSPTGSLVISMAKLAAVSLAITVFAIISARVVPKVMRITTKAAHKFTETTMRTSNIAQSRQQRTHREENKDAVSPEVDLSERPSGQESRTGSTSSAWTFWLAYLLIEVPVREIGLAYQVLPAVLQHQPVEQPTWKAILHTGKNILRVLKGFLMLPILLILGSLQLLFYNILDILVLIGGWAQRNIHNWLESWSATPFDKKLLNRRTMTWWRGALIKLRPVRELDRKIRETAANKRQAEEQSKEEKAGGEEEDEPESGEISEVEV